MHYLVTGVTMLPKLLIYDMELWKEKNLKAREAIFENISFFNHSIMAKFQLLGCYVSTKATKIRKPKSKRNFRKNKR